MCPPPWRNISPYTSPVCVDSAYSAESFIISEGVLIYVM